MSGVLHPEGPEPVRTYWVRRVLVLFALVILMLVGLGLARVSSGATRSTAPPALPPTSDLTPSPAPSASVTSIPSLGSQTSSSPTSSSAPSTSSSEQGLTATCERDQLEVSLSGKQMLKLAQPAGFLVTLRNGGDEACTVNLAKDDFELKVSSGKKLIWSSRACSTATFAVVAKLELDQSMSWTMGWDGRGIAAGCTQAGPPPKAGTYLATAQLTGAKAAKLPITMRD